MTTQEVFGMLDQARKLNFVGYVAWGGEPLIRPDTMEILRHSHDVGLFTCIITNGTYLSRHAKEMAKTVDLTIVSLDYPSDYHDVLRGSKGCFSKAINGIAELKKFGGRVALNCVFSKLNAHAATEMAELAKRLGVRIAFDPMEVFSGFNQEHALSAHERRGVFAEVWKLKKSGYPVLNSFEFLEHLVNPVQYSCAQSKVYVNVRENGEVTPFWCQKDDKSLGSLKIQSLSKILGSNRFKEFSKNTANCFRCNNSVTGEISKFYSVSTFFKNCSKIPSPILDFITYYGLSPKRNVPKK
jgi:MoaA/NifB/PqqE/SkfB family radical SAM enzyme